ncbi:MAG: hypothetical protein QGF07_01835 [Phycisphaerales bacterium]|jgi:hypothetical protein|nr:hypothetical protein [Phycisphaerales bacterium]
MSLAKTQIALWEKVVGSTELLDAVNMIDPTKVNEVATLRKKWSANEVSVAIELCKARESAIGRLDNAKGIVADLVSVQQASSSAVSTWKAKRFNNAEVVDLCCGIGADLLQLPSTAVGVDCDPLRCWMARQNSGKKVFVGDARSYGLPITAMVHLDPSRRVENGRRLGLDEMRPNLLEVQEICSKVCGGCVKLSPSIDLEEVAIIGDQREVEYIEDRGRVTQGIVWFNELANSGCDVTATSLTTGDTVSGSIETPRISAEIGKWIYEPNPALERAKLHGSLGNKLDFWEPAFGLGLLCGNEQTKSNWFNVFEVLSTSVLRLEKVTSELRKLGAGEVEVKTRDSVVDPNVWQKELQKPTNVSNERLTVFALRLGKKRVAIIARRVKQ